MTLDKATLHVSLKNTGIKFSNGRGAPKIETASTSPVTLRESLRITEKAKSTTKRVHREGSKLAGH
jgi:hypothetical protein